MSALLKALACVPLPSVALCLGCAILAFLLGETVAKRKRKPELSEAQALLLKLPEVDALLVNETHIELSKLARLGYSRDEVKRAIELTLRFGDIEFQEPR